MKYILSIAISVFIVFSATANAEWDVGGGVESYKWKEIYQPNMTPKESGMRSAIHLCWTMDGDNGLLYAYRGKFYDGQVNYDTYIQQSGAPVSTKTEYSGAMNEGRLFYRTQSGNLVLDFAGGLGVDAWQRSIGNSGNSQIEDYFIGFLRTGVSFDNLKRGAGLHGGWGLKYPFWTREDAHLDSLGYTSNPIITPGKSISFYAELGYRINNWLDVTGYYDSWRFRQSEIVYTSNQQGGLVGIIQPESSMDALGVNIMFSF